LTVLQRRLSIFVLASCAVIVGSSLASRPVSAQQPQIVVKPIPVTADQQAKLNALHTTLAHQLQVLAADKGRTKAQKEAALKKIAAKYAADVAAVYTPAQRAEMAQEGGMVRQAWVEEHQQSTEAHEREVEYDRLEKQAIGIAAAVNQTLTADQKKKIAALQAASKTQSNAVKADATLTSDQREQKLNDIEQQLESSVNAILTPDQKIQFDRVQKIMARQAQLLLGAEPKAAKAAQ
jgi:hypothetical protein